MNDEELLAFSTIEQLGDLLRKRKISAFELTETFLRRIERQNPALNAFLTVTRDDALAVARRADKELSRSRGGMTQDRPLLGIPITLKDNIWTRGIKTTAGSKILRDFIPAADATVARKLARAGAVLVGKTNLNEFAYGVTGANAHYGPTHNPWALERIPGGSSAGSAAATAAGLCTASVGSDTGGSIRIPSALCGIVGLKPSFGRVSVYGTMPLAPSLDHIGLLARTVKDVATMLGILAGRDPFDPTSVAQRVEDFRGALGKRLPKFRLGKPREHYWEKLDPEVRHASEAAVRDLAKHGAVIREISLPHLHESLDAATDVSLAEALHTHQAAGYFPSRAGDYGEEVRQRIDSGKKVMAARYLAAMDIRKTLLAEFETAFRDVDVILAPTVPVPAPQIGEENVNIDEKVVPVRPALVGLNRPANITGLPALSIPCGFTRQGLPIGLQLIGRAFNEIAVLRVAESYERSHEWTSRHACLQ